MKTATKIITKKSNLKCSERAQSQNFKEYNSRLADFFRRKSVQLVSIVRSRVNSFFHFTRAHLKHSDASDVAN